MDDSACGRDTPFWAGLDPGGVTPKEFVAVLPVEYCLATDASIEIYALHPRGHPDSESFEVSDALVVLPYGQFRIVSDGERWQHEAAQPHNPKDRFPYSGGLIHSAWRALGGEVTKGAYLVEMAWVNPDGHRLYTYDNGGFRMEYRD